MKKYKLLTKPMEASDAIDFDYADDVSNWQLIKAERWQKRQQHRFKHQMI